MNQTIFSDISRCKSFLFKLLILAGFLYPSQFIFSQTGVDSLEYLGSSFRQNLLSTRFDKQLNTYYLLTSLKYKEDFDDFSFRVEENFNSTFVRAATNSTRDDQRLRMVATYKMNNKTRFGILGSNSIFSDNRKLEINQASISYATLFTELEPIKKISVSPFFGYSNNRQVGENNFGFLYGIEGTADNLLISDFRINSELRFRNEDVLPRRNLIRYLNLSAANYFDKDISNTTSVFYAQSRKDFYFETDSLTKQQFNINSNIQSRTETIYYLRDRLSYNNVFDLFDLDFSGQINWRTVDRETRYKNTESSALSLFDTKIEEIKIDFETVSRYSSRFFNGTLRFALSERDEKNITKPVPGIDAGFFEQRSELEQQKNNNSLKAAIAFFGDVKLSEKDRLSFSLLHNKLRYDTPSGKNDDDRDELLSIARLRYTRFLNPYFEAFINAEGTVNHTVYIYSSRSSNNNINRVIRLKAGGDYTGSRLSSYNSFEVSANYTVYDFEDVAINFQSFSFRQFTGIDSTNIKLSERISLFTYGYVRLSEQGDFKWDSFSSRPTRYLQEIYIEPRFILEVNSSQISIGIRYFSLNTFGYEGREKLLETEYSSIGPISRINVQLWRSFEFLLNGFYEFISSSGTANRQQANLSMQVNWKF